MALLKPREKGLPGRAVPARTPLALWVWVLLAALPPASRALAQNDADEYQVKAAYILNFARFVEWPPDSLSASSPITIAVVGNDPFNGALEHVLRGRSANGHAIHLRYVRWNEITTPCQIVFISAAEEPHLPEILRLIGSGSVLTVSDIERFSLRGGMIEFSMVGNRVRFDIDRSPAIAARLNISSKLLSVARAVHEGTTR
jgi:hypothetical protein